MLVRQLIGRYAGDVVDMAPHVAKQQILSGRAIDIRSEEGAPVKRRRKRAKKQVEKVLA